MATAKAKAKATASATASVRVRVRVMLGDALHRVSLRKFWCRYSARGPCSSVTMQLQQRHLQSRRSDRGGDSRQGLAIDASP